jgi:ribosomal peptide maturation radical SAM protein 1
MVAESVYLNLELAAEIGITIYETISGHRSTALGEWLFARAAFEDEAPPPIPFLEAYGETIERLLAAANTNVTLDDLLAFREEGAMRFLERHILREGWGDSCIFGLTSTHQQNTAGFALARLLKRHYPGCVVIAGGANFDGEMGVEWLRSVRPIDIVVSGEADEAFPALLKALRDGRSIEWIPNLILRTLDGTGAFKTTSNRPFHNLDMLPVPNYDEYFITAERLGLLSKGARRDVDIPFEASRGCWWGERHHCTFCGLNGETMAYRSKSGNRVLEELATQARRYQSYRFTAVDNILDMKLYKSLFPQIAERGISYDLFFEIKSNTSPKRLEELRAAGVRRVQPGIESLSTAVLRLMNKGVTAIANVNLLRWCRILEIDAGWNLIWGFPGEREEDYMLQLKLIPLLIHLQPPIGAGRIWLERFSPLFREKETSQAPMRPDKTGIHIYPTGLDLERASYFFEYELRTEVSPSVYESVRQAVDDWKESDRVGPGHTLEYRYSPGFLQIDDRRYEESAGTFTFEGEVAELYAAIATAPLPISQLEEKVSLGADQLSHTINELCRFGLAMRDGDHVLALALPPAGTKP